MDENSLSPLHFCLSFSYGKAGTKILECSLTDVAFLWEGPLPRFTYRMILATALVAVVGLSAAPPATAQPMSGQHASNRNIWRVRHQLERDINQLQHDDRDYGGHRVAAIERFNVAHNELLQAEEFEHRHPVTLGSGVSPNGPIDRGQRGSNRNIWIVHRSVDRLIVALQHDASDYGGHKAAAMQAMQDGRAQLVAAEGFARAHGY